MRHVIWIAGPYSWENPVPIDRLVASLAGRYGISPLVLVSGGGPGVAKHLLDSATERGVVVLEAKPAFTVWNHKAVPMRDRLIADVLPIDLLIALHYLPLNDLNHREVRSAINAAREKGIKTKIVQISPENAMPSSVSVEAPGSEARRAAKAKGRKK